MKTWVKRGVNWGLHSLSGSTRLATALVVGSLAALLWWVQQPSSLGLALQWGLQWAGGPLAQQVRISEVQGSLTEGGRVGQLSWQSEDGLSVTAQDVSMAWSWALIQEAWRSQRVTLSSLRVARVDIIDQRPSTPYTPPDLPTQWTLPWLQSLDAQLMLDELNHRSGNGPVLQVRDVQARYHYEAPTAQANPGAHTLAVAPFALSMAQHQATYAVDARLGLSNGHPLDLRMDAQVALPSGWAQRTAQHLPVQLHLNGELSPTEDEPTLALTLEGHLKKGKQTVGVALQTQLLPKRVWPLGPLQAQLDALPLAALWPAAPDALLSGQAHVRLPEGATHSQGMPSALQADIDLRNATPGPWDQAKLPLQRLQGRLHWEHNTLTIPEVQLSTSSSVATVQAKLSHGPSGWQGQASLKAPQLNSKDGWSTAPWGAGNLQADWRDHTLSIQLAPTHPTPPKGTPALPQLDATLTLGADASTPWQLRWRTQTPGFADEGQWTFDPLTSAADPLLTLMNGHGEWHMGRTQPATWAPWLLASAQPWLSAESTRAAQDALAWLGPLAFPQPLQASITKKPNEADWTLTLPRELLSLQWQPQRLPASLKASAPWAAQLQAMTWHLSTSTPLQLRWTPALANTPARWRWQANTLQAKLDTVERPLALHFTDGQSQGREHHGAFTLPTLSTAWLEAVWPKLSRQPSPMALLGTQGNLDLSAELQLQARQGQFNLTRLQGDWTLPTGNATRIRELQAQLSWTPQTINGQLRFDSAALGRIDGTLSTPAIGLDDLNQPLGQRPIQGQIKLQAPDVQAWAKWIPPGWRIAGQAQAQVALTGTLQRPVWAADLTAQDLSVRSVVAGIDLRNGQLQAQATPQRVTLQRLSFVGAGDKSSQGGQLTVQGQAEWRGNDTQPHIDLTLQANKLKLLSRVDRRVTLSAELNSQWRPERWTTPTLKGQLTFDQADITLPDHNKPRLGSDVVVLGNDTTPPPLWDGWTPEVAIRIGLGQQFRLRGLGLQTQLVGNLDLKTSPTSALPQVFGDITPQNGTIQAYGQKLKIDSGTLRFNGPADNPRLDLLALRSHPTMRVGVQVQGTAQAPLIGLYSSPKLTDIETLSWLVLGRPATGNSAQAALLQQAALALLSQPGQAPTDKLMQRLGLDELSFEGESVNADGSTNTASLTLGKRLSDELYVSYAKSISGLTGTFSVFYDLSRQLTLRAQTGEQSAIDLIWTRQYD